MSNLTGKDDQVTAFHKGALRMTNPQDADLSTPTPCLGQSFQRESQKSFLSDIEFWLTSFGWILMTGEGSAACGWMVPEYFRTDAWFASQGRGLTYRLQDAVALQVSYSLWVLPEHAHHSH